MHAEMDGCGLTFVLQGLYPKDNPKLFAIGPGDSHSKGNTFPSMSACWPWGVYMTWGLPIETVAAYSGMHVTMAHRPRGFEMYAEMYACIGQDVYA